MKLTGKRQSGKSSGKNWLTVAVTSLAVLGSVVVSDSVGAVAHDGTHTVQSGILYIRFIK